MSPKSPQLCVLRKSCRLSFDLRGARAPVLFIQGVRLHGDGRLPQAEAVSGRLTCLSSDNRGVGRNPLAGARLTPICGGGGGGDRPRHGATGSGGRPLGVSALSSTAAARTAELTSAFGGTRHQITTRRSQFMANKASKGKGKPIPKVEIRLEVTPGQGEELLSTLKERFEKNMGRHMGLDWSPVGARLNARPEKLSTLHAMESTGGEPDIVGFDKSTDEYIFYDCSAQSPIGRRSICYDGKAQAEREKKGVYPAGNAIDIAAAMGVEILDEDQYRALQKLGEFDTKTESWIKTPDAIRKLGGAIFADRRYDHVFVFHNSAPSFYAARGFRGSLRV